jgi:peptide/nickel transport system permease protein
MPDQPVTTEHDLILGTRPLTEAVDLGAPEQTPEAGRSFTRPLIEGVVGVALLVTGTAVLTGGVGALVTVVGIIAVLAAAIDLSARIRGRADVHTPFWLSVIWLVVLVVLAALVSVLPLPEGRDPAKALDVQALLPPDVFSTHPLGTDTQALDVLTGLLYGARVSLIVAVGGVLIGGVVGGLVGLVAGYRRGKLDAVIGFITDVMLSFPALILLLALVTILRPNVVNVTIALGVLAIPGYVRLARANTIKIASRDFVIASRTLGARRNRIMVREVLPNVAPSLLAYSFIVVGFLIVAEASLSFLGLGIQRPNPTWGNIIAQGEPYLDQHPFLVLCPATLLFFTVVSMNYIGQRLQKKWGL